MNQTTISQLTQQLKKFYELSGIPLCLCDSNGKSIFLMPAGLGMAPLKNYLSTFIASYHHNHFVPAKPMIRITQLNSLIGLVQLANNLYLFAGPLPTYRLTHTEILEAYSKIFSPDSLLELCESMAKTPIYTYRKFLCALSLIIELCTGKHNSYEEIAIMNHSLLPDAKITNEPFTFLHFDKSISYSDILSYEDSICDTIAAGNLHLLNERFMNPFPSPFSHMYDGPLIREKYSFIALSSLVVRAAIRGGMPHEAAFSLGEIYCQKMDTLSSLGEIEAFTYKMIRDFCTKVAGIKAGNDYSPIIRKCQNYIYEHLHDEICLNDLADLCNVSSRTISSHFKKTLNMSVPEYITNEKLKESQYLLAHTQYSISEISHFLKFSSQSYFTHVFRKTFGCTPLQYRCQNS